MSSSNPSRARHQDFLIDGLMPAREVSLIAGPSGAGKTTLLVQLIEWFRAGALIFGCQSHPAGVVYVTCDRSRPSFLRSLDRHGVAHDAFPWEVSRKIVTAGAQADPLGAVLSWCHSQHPEARLLCVDGLGSLVPDGKISDYSIVADFLLKAQFRCECWDLTVLGTVHATKTKEGERFLNPRQRILGSVAWAAFSDLIIVISPQHADDPESQVRVVDVLPRDAAEFQVKLENHNGILIPFEIAAELDSFSILDLDILKVSVERVVSTAELVAMGAERDIQVATVKRWISAATSKSLLTKVSHGRYQRVSQA